MTQAVYQCGRSDPLQDVSARRESVMNPKIDRAVRERADADAVVYAVAGERGRRSRSEGASPQRDAGILRLEPAAVPRVTLLDGFTLRAGGPRPGVIVGDLPRSVQRLVAHVSLSGRPGRAAISGHLCRT